jgi:hypothetical protein
MGEIAEMMMDGTVCQECGEYLDPDDGYDPPGDFPRFCRSCAKRNQKAKVAQHEARMDSRKGKKR